MPITIPYPALLPRLRRPNRFRSHVSRQSISRWRPSRDAFEKVRHPIVIGGDAVFVQKNPGVATMVGTVQADMQDDLASPHSRLLSAGENEIDRLLEIARRQTVRVR